MHRWSCHPHRLCVRWIWLRHKNLQRQGCFLRARGSAEEKKRKEKRRRTWAKPLLAPINNDLNQEFRSSLRKSSDCRCTRGRTRLWNEHVTAASRGLNKWCGKGMSAVGGEGGGGWGGAAWYINDPWTFHNTTKDGRTCYLHKRLSWSRSSPSLVMTTGVTRRWLILHPECTQGCKRNQFNFCLTSHRCWISVQLCFWVPSSQMW